MTTYISSHILDTARGMPAAQVLVKLFYRKEETWIELSQALTDDNGRVARFETTDFDYTDGVYKLIFDTESYYAASGEKSFFPFVEIAFFLTVGAHYHVPLLLSPFGYSTYRGS